MTDAFYNPRAPALGRLLSTARRQNREALSGVHGDQLKRLDEHLDLQHRIASDFFWAFFTEFYRERTSDRLLLSAFHKNLFGLASALLLTRERLYGSARPILRQAFEALVISKFASVTNDDAMLQAWTNGEDIYLSHAVLRKLSDRTANPLRVFWRLLCQFSHATVYAQQTSPFVIDHAKDVATTLNFIEMLLACNYHLLNSHLLHAGLTQYHHYVRKKSNVPAWRLRARRLFRQATWGTGGRSLVWAFRSSWMRKARA